MVRWYAPAIVPPGGVGQWHKAVVAGKVVGLPLTIPSEGCQVTEMYQIDVILKYN